MLHKTRGVVFHVTDYSETSVVAKIYTELFGLQSYLINSVRKKNPKVRPAALQPLALTDLVVYHKDRGGLRRVADVRNNPVLQSIPFDVRKSSILLFLNEVLYKSVREEETNQQLFDFMFNAIHLLDLQQEPNPDFHLIFLMQLTRFLGFYPRENFSDENPVFNLQDGGFQEAMPVHPFFTERPLSDAVFRLMKASVNFSDPLNIATQEKRVLLEKLIDYYQLHVSGFGNIRSHKVLEAVWS